MSECQYQVNCCTLSSFSRTKTPRRTAPAYIEKHRHFEPTRSCDHPFRDVDPTDRDTASIIQRLRPTSEGSRYKSEHTLASPWPGLPCSPDLQSRSPSGTFQKVQQQHQEQEIKSTRIRNRQGLKGKSTYPKSSNEHLDLPQRCIMVLVHPTDQPINLLGFRWRSWRPGVTHVLLYFIVV